MNKIEKKIEWNKYIISLSPIFLIFYISNETYAIDYRAFYLAGKSVLNNLNPYLNHISLNNIYNSSYLKSLNCNRHFQEFDTKVFLDIGLIRSCLIVYKKNTINNHNNNNY